MSDFDTPWQTFLERAERHTKTPKMELELLGNGLRLIGGKRWPGGFRSDVFLFGDVIDPKVREIAILTVRDLVTAKLMNRSALRQMEVINRHFGRKP